MKVKNILNLAKNEKIYLFLYNDLKEVASKNHSRYNTRSKYGRCWSIPESTLMNTDITAEIFKPNFEQRIIQMNCGINGEADRFGDEEEIIEEYKKIFSKLSG